MCQQSKFNVGACSKEQVKLPINNTIKEIANFEFKLQSNHAKKEMDYIFRELQEKYDIHQVISDEYEGIHTNTWKLKLLVTRRLVIKETIPFQYHGYARMMPKRLRGYFESQNIKFSYNEMVDVIEWVDIELVNRWED